MKKENVKESDTPSTPSSNFDEEPAKKGTAIKNIAILASFLVLFVLSYLAGNIFAKKASQHPLMEKIYSFTSEKQIPVSNKKIESNLEEAGEIQLAEDAINQEARALEKKLAEIKTENKKEEQENNLAYENKEFGFRLKFTPEWKNLKFRESYLGGDFEVYMVEFYLPTKEINEFAEFEGYFNPFNISVYVKESWDDPLRDKSMDGMAGEEVGRNESYVFLYSHFNGDPPSDISKQAIRDMGKIAKNIEVFKPDNYTE